MQHIEYGHLNRSEYYQLTQFESNAGRSIQYEDWLNLCEKHEKLYLKRIQISGKLASIFINYISKENLETRGNISDDCHLESLSFNKTLYTVNFALHLISGKRGGWFIIDSNGREPLIKDEFIGYGKMRKSGTRKNRYRRNLSGTEQNHVDFLKAKTPSINKLCEWFLKKYPNEVLNLDFHTGENKSTIFDD